MYYFLLKSSRLMPLLSLPLSKLKVLKNLA